MKTIKTEYDKLTDVETGVGVVNIIVLYEFYTDCGEIISTIGFDKIPSLRKERKLKKYHRELKTKWI